MRIVRHARTRDAGAHVGQARRDLRAPGSRPRPRSNSSSVRTATQPRSNTNRDRAHQARTEPCTVRSGLVAALARSRVTLRGRSIERAKRTPECTAIVRANAASRARSATAVITVCRWPDSVINMRTASAPSAAETAAPSITTIVAPSTPREPCARSRLATASDFAPPGCARILYTAARFGLVDAARSPETAARAARGSHAAAAMPTPAPAPRAVPAARSLPARETAPLSSR